MVVFYSGYGCKLSDPEVVFKRRATFMLTYYDSHAAPKPQQRFRRHRKARQKAKAAPC